ncbi:MAG: universal stress protein [Solirubrobacteraceae bacterium]
MGLDAIVSYDDTDNDIDALALGRLLRAAGARLTLAYVRHATHRAPLDEEASQRDAEALLKRGAARLGDAGVARRVLVSASTGEGLGWLAERDRFDLIVFGSEYRARPGRVCIGRSAQALLDGGPAALALAPSGFAARPACEIASVGVLHGTADEAAIETAFTIAERLRGTVVDRDRDVDLLIVGSRPQAPEGRLTVAATALNAIEDSACPVLAVARGTALEFPSLAPV